MPRDIQWETQQKDGVCYQVRVSYFGKKFKFQFLEEGSEQWDYKRKPVLDDLKKLQEILQRKYQRRQVGELELKEIERLIREQGN